MLALPIGPAWDGTRTTHSHRTKCKCCQFTPDDHLLFVRSGPGIRTQPLPYSSVNPETDFVEGSHPEVCSASTTASSPGPGGKCSIARADPGGPGFVRVLFYRVGFRRPSALTEENILVGCMVDSHYYSSTSMSSTWQPPGGHSRRDHPQPRVLREKNPEYLGNGRFACAGHYSRRCIWLGGAKP